MEEKRKMCMAEFEKKAMELEHRYRMAMGQVADLPRHIPEGQTVRDSEVLAKAADKMAQLGDRFKKEMGALAIEMVQQMEGRESA